MIRPCSIDEGGRPNPDGGATETDHLIPYGIIVNDGSLRIAIGMAQAPRDRITIAAQALFATEGLRVSVDAIAARASTTKMAVYRSFGSKDALVLAWLQSKIAEYVDAMDGLRRRYPGDADAQIIGWTAFITDGLSSTSYRGCPFVNSLAELPEGDGAARRLIEVHKRTQLARLETLCSEADLKQATHAAGQINLALEGAQIVAQNKSDPLIGGRTQSLVRLIIETHRSPQSL